MIFHIEFYAINLLKLIFKIQCLFKFQIKKNTAILKRNVKCEAVKSFNKMQKKTSGELKTVSIQFKNAFMHNTVWILPHFLIYIQLDFKPVSTTGLICIFGHFFMKPIYEISFKEIFKKPRL